MKSLSLFLVLFVIIIFFQCKSGDGNTETRGGFTWVKSATEQYECSCDDSDCVPCVCTDKGQNIFHYNSISDGACQRCLDIPPQGSPGSGSHDTLINPDSIFSMQDINFLAADSISNKWNFDDWRENSARSATKISYLPMAAGCSTKFRINILYDTTVYDSFKLELSGDAYYELSFLKAWDIDTLNIKSRDTIITVYSIDDDHEGTATVHVYGYNGPNVSYCLAGEISECENTADQLIISVHKKGGFLNMTRVDQTGYPSSCQLATGTMVLQWYYRKHAYDMTLNITLDDVIEWVWGDSIHLSDDQGIPLCNKLGSYNVLCAKMEPNTGNGPCGCSTDCADAGECLTCEADTAGYDETVDRCCYMGWYPSDKINYKGKHPAYPRGNLPTSFRFGINCLLKTAYKYDYWSNVDLVEISNKCWGVMDPKTLAAQIDNCRPVPIWGGETIIDANSHAVVICGYELDADTANEDMEIFYMDPLDPGTWHEYKSLKWSTFKAYYNWKQSLYLQRSPYYISDCGNYCR